MRQAEPLGDARGNGDGPVDPWRDDAVDAFCVGQPLEGRLVLGRDERAPVGVPEAERRRIAVGGDDEGSAPARGFEQPELRRPGA
jgi:hypothetical protein